jgi:hypothetical protein
MARKHWAKEEQTAIPSIKFLDSCLHLYFRDFHPTFPILHKATFSRHQSSPLLLLSMCSIGCIFMGTQAARERGLWIYERLHHVIVFSVGSLYPDNVLIHAERGMLFSSAIQEWRQRMPEWP